MVIFHRRREGWGLRVGDGRNEFFAEASENGGIVEDVKASDAQSSFG